MDKKIFFDAIRKDIPLTTGNVAGFERIVGYGETHGVHIKNAAYVTATSYWETAHTMQPVREAYWLSEDWRKKNLRYYPWYGRGDVQLTWEENYKLAGKELSLDLTTDPNKVLEPDISVQILYKGMEEGWFTKKKLSDYITLNTTQTYALTQAEYKNARRIVNGTDKADEIAAIALKLYKALQKASYSPVVQSKPEVVKTPVRPPVIPTEPIVEEMEQIISFSKADLAKVTLLDLYKAMKTLNGDD